MLIRSFGHFPTVDEIYARMEHMNKALDHPIPESVEVHRGVADFDFIKGFKPRDPRFAASYQDLVGRTHEEPGYTSTSLGKEPAFNTYAFRLHLKVPEGTPGLWLGKESIYPNQRELILAPGVKYRITKVTLGPDDKLDVEAEVIP
jgi:hypothetical protein